MSEVSSVLRWADAEVGYLEKKSNKDLDDKIANAGNGNYTKYWRDLEPSFQGQAWCNCFINWCFMKAFGDGRAKYLLYSKEWSYYTPTSSDYFKKAGQWYNSPRVGDIIYFKNSQRIHHVGIVYKVSSTTVYTIEGNTSAGSQVIPNGGGVCKKSYTLNNSSIAGYGRPGYSDAEKVEIVDIAATSDRRGLKILADKLNVRKTPIDGSIVRTLNKNERTPICGKVKVNNEYWFRLSDGYISGKYVEGWIKEANNQWWYVKEGYTYPSNGVYTIDGNDYVFDRDGWMITKDRLASSGALKSI